jgi:hypothetical protein
MMIILRDLYIFFILYACFMRVARVRETRLRGPPEKPPPAAFQTTRL